METMRAWINPLACIPLQRLGTTGEPRVDAPQLLAYLFAPEADGTIDAFVARYREVAFIPSAFPFAPAEPTILEKLVWPLRHAVGSYCLANYLGCVALCGMVGEMVALLLWEISPYPRANPAMGDREQRQLFGRTFEQLGQERRMDVLRAFRLIDDEIRAAFEVLRTTRNRYLHLLSVPHDSLAADARTALEATRKVVASVLGLSIKDGAVGVRPDLMAYLAANEPSLE